MKIIIALIILFIISASIVWVDENSGRVIVDWFQYQIEFSTSFLITVVLLVCIVLIIIISTFSGILSLPRFFRKVFSTSENTKIKLLEDSFSALLANDYDSAEKTSKKLLKLTDADPKYRKLAQIVASKTAQEKGDFTQANLLFNNLVENKQLKFYATKGLLQTSFSEGDIDSALKHAETAHNLNPDADNSSKNLLELYKKAGKWKEAEDFAKRNSRGFFNRSATALDKKKELAEIKFLYARELLMDADGRKAFLDLAIDNLLEAVKLQPNNDDAVLILIKLCMDNNRRKDAKTAIEHYWKTKTNKQIGIKYIEDIYPYISGTDKNYSGEKLKLLNIKAAKLLQKLNDDSVSQELVHNYAL